MGAQWTPFHGPLVVSAGLAAAVAVLAWRRRDRPGARPLAVFALAAGGWTIAELGGLTATGVEAKAFWLSVELTFSAVVPAAWALIALEYAGSSGRTDRRRVALLSVEPIVFTAVTWAARDLVFTTPTRRLVGGAGGYYIGTQTLEAGFLAHAAYSYLLVVGATGLVVVASTRERGLRWQGVTMSLAMIVLLAANVAWLIGLTPPGLDPTNLAFVVSGALLLVGIYRHRVLEVVPAVRSMARRQLFADLPDAVVAVGPTGAVVDVNDTAEAVFDVDRATVAGEPLTAVLPALDDPGTELVHDHDGEQRYFDVRRTDLGGPGSSRGQLLTLRDVTELRRTEQRYRRLLSRSLDLVTVVDVDGTITYESPSVRNVLGYEPEDRIGADAFQHVHPDDRAAVMDALASALESPGGEESVEFRVRSADGAWTWLEARGRNLLEDPVVEGIVVNSRDVTDRKHREQQLDVLNRVLRHNLRNELSVVTANAEQIDDRSDDGDVTALARGIVDAAGELVDYATKAREAERVVDRRDVDAQIAAGPLVEHAVASARDRHSAARFSVSVETGATVRALASLDVALANLLDNAVEHNDSPVATVDVSVRREESGIAISVTDDGPGIPESERDVLLSGEESPLHHGSGLGLWLVNWIVDRSGGDVDFAPSDTGTTVTVTLPEAQAATDDGSTAPPDGGSSSKTVDEPSTKTDNG